MNVNRVFRSAVIRMSMVLVVISTPLTVQAKYASISSPTTGSSWDAGANLSVYGSFDWEVDTANGIYEPRPTTGFVYIHAGTNAGSVTNSATVTISDIVYPMFDPDTGTEDYTASLTLTPTTPRIGQGNPPYGTYYVEVASYFQGMLQSNASRSINVKNG